MSNLRSVGREAEDQAADYLLGLGYTIVTRRFKSHHGEIDLVTLSPDQSTLVFVEVKSRRSTKTAPEQAVNWTKRQHFHQAVKEYFEKTDHPNLPARYDVIAIDPNGLRHHQNAFRGEQ